MKALGVFSRFARGVAALLLAGGVAQAWATPPATFTGDGEARVFARADNPKSPAAALKPARDREGNLYLAERGEWDIRKVDSAGHATLHASLPRPQDPGDADSPPGILAMTLDPASGDVLAEDAFGRWRVSSAGEVTALVEPPGVPSHEAVEHPAAEATPPPPVSQASFTAVSKPSPRPRSCAGSARTGPTARQKSLAHFRKIQLEIRNYKKQQRLARKLEAQAKAEEQAARTEAARLEALDGAPRLPRATRNRPGPRLGGLFCLALLIGAAADPAILGALAQDVTGFPGPGFNVTALIDRYSAQTTASLEALGPPCLAALLAAPSIAPCGFAYRMGALAQVGTLREDLLNLLVPPSSLPAPVCVRGESPDQAKARIKLAQSDLLAEYDRLAADGWVMQFQLERDGYAVQGAGEAVLLGQAAVEAAGGNATALATLVATELGQVGTSLVLAAYSLQAAGDLPAALANLALTYKSKYQRWTASQAPAILRSCTGSAASSAPSIATSLLPPTLPPLSAVNDAMLQLSTACSPLGQPRLTLPPCSSGAIAEFQERAGALAALYQELICLASQQAACPGAPTDAADLLSYTEATYAEFQNEIHAMGFLFQGAGNSLFAASEIPLLVSYGAHQAGNSAEANALTAQEHGLMVIGRELYAHGYELQRIGAVSRQWVADLTLILNAESRARLDAAGPGSSSADTGPGSSTGSVSAPLSSTAGGPGPFSRSAVTGIGRSSGSSSATSMDPGSTGPDTAPGRFASLSSSGAGTEAGPGPSVTTAEVKPGSSTGPPASTASVELSTSAATRTRPFRLRGLAQALFPALSHGSGNEDL